jgi:hypothetical protein
MTRTIRRHIRTLAAAALLALAVGTLYLAPTAVQAEDNRPTPRGKSCMSDSGLLVPDGFETTEKDGKRYTCKDGTLVVVTPTPAPSSLRVTRLGTLPGGGVLSLR